MCVFVCDIALRYVPLKFSASLQVLPVVVVVVIVMFLAMGALELLWT
jgi:hypothetical protein